MTRSAIQLKKEGIRKTNILKIIRMAKPSFKSDLKRETWSKRISLSRRKKRRKGLPRTYLPVL